MNPLRKLMNTLTRAPTFGDLRIHFDNVLETRTLAPATLRQYKSDFKHLDAAFLGMAVRDIRPHHIAALIKKLMDLGKCGTARQVLWLIRDMLNEALILGWVNDNAAKHVKAPKKQVRRNRLTLEQWQSVHDYATVHQPPWVARAWTLALVSGQRCADLAKMRFDDVRNGLLHVQQQKKGARIALPLALRLDALGLTLGEAINRCRSYEPEPGAYLLRSAKDGGRVSAKSLSNRISEAMRGAGVQVAEGTLPTLHEARSLAERLYRAQGIDTKTLLGHKHQSMTDAYNDDRGLGAEDWKVLQLPTMEP